MPNISILSGVLIGEILELNYMKSYTFLIFFIFKTIILIYTYMPIICQIKSDKEFEKNCQQF